MKREQDEFRDLRRCLALKRHEQPPPGYFDRFSGEVIARIRAGESGEEESLLGWLQRVWAALESKPVFAGTFGLAVCGLLVSAIIYTERAETLATVEMPAIEEPAARVVHVAGENLSPLFQASGRSDGGVNLEIGQPRSSLFEEYRLRRIHQAQQPLFAPVVDQRPYAPGVN